MKFLLVEPKVKAKAPNIALMKWARWCENNKYECVYVRGKVVPNINPDKIKQELSKRFGLSGIEEKNSRSNK